MLVDCAEQQTLVTKYILLNIHLNTNYSVAMTALTHMIQWFTEFLNALIKFNTFYNIMVYLFTTMSQISGQRAVYSSVVCLFTVISAE